MKLHIVPFTIKLKNPLRTAHGELSERETLLVGLEAEGKIGWGEASIPPQFEQDKSKIEATLEKVRPQLESIDIMPKPDKLWKALDATLRKNTFAQSALDVAAWSLYAKTRNTLVSRILGTHLNATVPSAFTLTIEQPQRVIDSMLANPWPIYKIKIKGIEDLATLAAIRQINPDPLIVDANESLSLDESIQLVKALGQLQIDVLEQPLARNLHLAQRRLYQTSEITLLADESFCVEADLGNCSQEFHGINLKLGKCGGITPALRIIRRARALNLRIVLGCFVETSVGIAPLRHLAPLVDFLDADSPLFIENDPVVRSVYFDKGYLEVPESTGTGVECTVATTA